MVELLVVITLVAILSVLAVPAFVSIAQGSGMKRAVVGLSDSLEQARTEAMATSTWVLVGISPDSSASPPNVTVMAVASRDGTTNTAASNLLPLSKPVRLDSVKVLETATTPDATILKNSQFEFTTTVAGKPRKFSDTVIAFSPQGEALLKTSELSPWIEIPLQELRGSTPIASKTASIRVSGVSGQVIVNY